MAAASVEGGAEAENEAPVLFKRKRMNGRANQRKVKTPSPAASSDEDSDDDDSSIAQAGHGVKRVKKNAGIATTSSSTKAASDVQTIMNSANRQAAISNLNDATKQSNWYEENAKDLRSVKPSSTQTQEQASSQPPSKSFGPAKAPTNVRMTTMFDYAPDVCKDYKQTGYCGFGDSCKFIHDRGDYKQGWELDRDWDVAAKNKKGGAGADAAEDDEDDILKDIPFACIICRESYKYPIVTKCGHYFCEKCALDRYKKDPNCAACGQGTNGIFNSASKLKKLLEMKRKAKAEAEETEE